MKKVILIGLFLFLISTISFAQDIIVQKITGLVRVQVSSTRWDEAVVYMKLSPSTVISVGLNSSCVLLIDGKLLTFKSMQTGTIKTLADSTSKGTGIKLGSQITESDVKASSDQGRTNISTASTRASDATKDVEWEQ